MANNFTRRRLLIEIDLMQMRGHAHPAKVVLLPAQVASLSGISVAKLARMRRGGSGPRAERFGRHYLYRLPEVLAWIDGQAISGAETRHGA